MVIFDATGLFHFKERHCLKKVLNKGSKDERAVYYYHVLEAKIVLGDGFVVNIGTKFKKEGRGYGQQKNSKKYILRPAGNFGTTAHSGRYIFYIGLWIVKSRLTKAIIVEGSGLWQDVKFCFPQKIRIRFLLL